MTRRPGFTLLDMLVVIGGLAVLSALSAPLLVNLQRLQNSVHNDDEHLRNNMTLADRFRQDVAESLSTLEREGGYQAGADCVILKAPGDRVVTWRLQSNEAVRREFGPGERDARTAIPLGGEGTTAAFVPDPSQRLVVLRISGPRDEAGRKQARSLEIVAAVGGDRP